MIYDCIYIALLAIVRLIPGEKFVLFRRSLELYFFSLSLSSMPLACIGSRFGIFFFFFRMDAYEILFTRTRRGRDARAREAFDFYLVPGKF